MVSFVPIQTSEFNDWSFDDLKRINFIENPLENEDFSNVMYPSCEEEHQNQYYEDIDTLF